MQWFLVAVSLTAADTAPQVSAHQTGPGPSGEITCEIQTELYYEAGVAPWGIVSSVEGTTMLCMNESRFCALEGLSGVLPMVGGVFDARSCDGAAVQVASN